MWMGTAKVAKHFNVTARTVRRWLESGRLRGTRRASGRWYVRSSDLTRFERAKS